MVLRKTLSYGVMHLLVAMAVVFAVTGDVRAALAVGIVEPTVQTLAFAVHERLWRDRAASPRARLLKTLSYALMHLTVAIAVAFALTGSWAAALAVGLIEPLVQTVAFTLHDRAWARAERRPSPARA